MRCRLCAVWRGGDVEATPLYRRLAALLLFYTPGSVTAHIRIVQSSLRFLELRNVKKSYCCYCWTVTTNNNRISEQQQANNKKKPLTLSRLGSSRPLKHPNLADVWPIWLIPTFPEPAPVLKPSTLYYNLAKGLNEVYGIVFKLSSRHQSILGCRFTLRSLQVDILSN